MCLLVHVPLARSLRPLVSLQSRLPAAVLCRCGLHRDGGFVVQLSSERVGLQPLSFYSTVVDLGMVTCSFFIISLSSFPSHTTCKPHIWEYYGVDWLWMKQPKMLCREFDKTSSTLMTHTHTHTHTLSLSLYIYIYIYIYFFLSLALTHSFFFFPSFLPSFFLSLALTHSFFLFPSCFLSFHLPFPSSHLLLFSEGWGACWYQGRIVA